MFHMIKKKENKSWKSSNISEIMEWLRSLVAAWLFFWFFNKKIQWPKYTLVLFQFFLFFFYINEFLLNVSLLCNLRIFHGPGKNRIFKSKTWIKRFTTIQFRILSWMTRFNTITDVYARSHYTLTNNNENIKKNNSALLLTPNKFYTLKNL